VLPGSEFMALEVLVGEIFTSTLVFLGCLYRRCAFWARVGLALTWFLARFVGG
jgi:hypothetical protein